MENFGHIHHDQFIEEIKNDHMYLTPKEQRLIALGASIFFFLIFIAIGFISWLPLQYVFGVFVSIWGGLLSASLAEKISPLYDTNTMVWRFIGWWIGMFLFVIGIIYEIVIIIHK